MAYTGLGTDALNVELVDAAVRGVAKKMFKLRPLCTIANNPTRTLSYYRESATILSASTNLASGAEFPVASPIWEKNTAYMKKMGLASDVIWEDAITNRIDIIGRVQEKIGEAIAKVVDETIYNALNSAAGISAAVPVDYEWNSSTRTNRHPMDNLAEIYDLISQNYYTPDTIVCHPTEARLLTSNDDFKSTFAPNPKVIQAGETGFLGWISSIGNLKLVATPFATADQIIMFQSKKAITWNVVEGAKAVVEKKDGEYYRLKGWETGMAFVTDPMAIGKLTNTRL